MITIKEVWEEYSKAIPPTAPPVQYQEMRRAFYAGVLAFFKIAIDISTEFPEDKSADYLNNFYQELRHFEQMVRQGKA